MVQGACNRRLEWERGRGGHCLPPPHRFVSEVLPRTDRAVSRPRKRSFESPLHAHLSNPLDLRWFWFGVRARLKDKVFLTAEDLPSIDSADASVASLFADVVGTRLPPDFLSEFMSALPPTEQDRQAIG